jgi:hypothetical protein
VILNQYLNNNVSKYILLKPLNRYNIYFNVFRKHVSELMFMQQRICVFAGNRFVEVYVHGNQY